MNQKILSHDQPVGARLPDKRYVSRDGDTIVVPLNTEHMPALPLWRAVTQIMYNIAIAAAAVHSF